MTDDKNDKIEISVVVLKDRNLKDVKDLKNKTIGKIKIGEQEFVKETFNSMKKEIGQMSQLEYDSFIDFGNALYNGNVDAIILDEALRGMFEENHADFNEKTEVIKTYSYEKENVSTTVEVKDITSDTFTVYITGIDQRGTLGTRGRSDVNKIMTVNPKTHEILLVDIPRDYYIPQVCQANQKDKLTHTGIFGPDCTVSSVSNFFGVEINYYVKVNFSSFEKIIDALGGISVYSRYTFTAQGYNFYANQPNYMDGKAALAFSRERYSLPGGDNDRIKNQSLVLAAVIDKITSPAIITNYMGFMNSISGTFMTNMNESEINDLIKMQLNDMSGWNITSFAVNGRGATDWTPANGFNAYVTYPNMDSVNEAVEKMKQIKDGVILSAQQ